MCLTPLTAAYTVSGRSWRTSSVDTGCAESGQLQGVG